jgi:hypothetical protein
MLTAEEIGEVEAEASHYPKRDALCIDALISECLLRT